MTLIGPLWLFDDYGVYQSTLVALASIGAVALNLLTGTAGQVSLSNAPFLGVGAFAAVFASQLDATMPVGIAFAVVACAVLGWLVGLPAVRLRGMYLLLTTLGLLYVYLLFAQLYETHFGGAAGFTITGADLFGWKPETPADWYLLCAAAALLNTYIAYSLLNGQPGRAWRAIRHSEVVAEGLGVGVRRYKSYAFVTSSVMIGVQGALTAYLLGQVSSSDYTLNTAVLYVAMVVIGGLDSILGSVIGAAVVTLLPTLIGNVISTHPDWPADITVNAGPIATFLYGTLVVVLLLIAPRGLAGLARSLVLLARGSLHRLSPHPTRTRQGGAR